MVVLKNIVMLALKAYVIRVISGHDRNDLHTGKMKYLQQEAVCSDGEKVQGQYLSNVHKKLNQKFPAVFLYAGIRNSLV